MALSAGTRLGPYEILSPLGAGGMGEVWKARDTRLDRIVAIKRLAAPHSHRFEQEARAVAALNHPHICQIHDVGADYLVLEYIEGAPLKGPLPTETVVQFGIQIASALEEAHGKGILHRDLKPANVMVTTKGAAKLLDFGLAKLVDEVVDVTRTTDGTVLGTAAYMSPEQAEGKPLDARSDIFGFGAVLYELVSGSRAFGGTAVQVLNAMLRGDPPALDGQPALDRIVRQCLQKDPTQRFQRISDVRSALEKILMKPVDAQPSIAVLPFADMSAGKDHEWFSDGLSGEIINALTQVSGLKVIARTSAFVFKGQQQDIRRIAETLGVAWIGGHRIAQGLMPEALEFTEKGYALAPGNFFNIGQLAGILKRTGNHERSSALMAQIGDVTAFGATAGFIAYHLVLGELEVAADWFEKLIDQRDTRAPWIMPHMFDAALKSSPRWPKLARMMNLPA